MNFRSRLWRVEWWEFSEYLWIMRLYNETPNVHELVTRLKTNISGRISRLTEVVSSLGMAYTLQQHPRQAQHRSSEPCPNGC